MAGCKPEFLPVVVTAVEAALDPAYCLHGLLATTWLSGPMVVVNLDGMMKEYLEIRLKFIMISFMYIIAKFDNI